MKYVDFHFLDVGHGDCTIIEFPDRLTVVDINNCKTLDRESETEFRHRYKPPAPNPFFAGTASLGRTGAPRTFMDLMLEASREQM